MNLTKEQLAVGRVLLAEGPITSDFLEEQIRKMGDESVLAKAVKSCGHVSEALLVAALLSSYRIPRVKLTKYKISEEALRLLTTEDARRFRVVPLGKVGAITCLAVESVFEIEPKVIYRLRRILGGPVKLFQAAPQEIEEILNKYYPLPERQIHKVTPVPAPPERKRLIPLEHSPGWWSRVHTSEGPIRVLVEESLL